MICLRCDKEDFHEATHFVEQVYEGKNLSVETPTMECDHCGWFTVTLDQASILLHRTKETLKFEEWWKENYPHMIEMHANTHSVLAKNVIDVTKVVAKRAWMAATEVSKVA